MFPFVGGSRFAHGCIVAQERAFPAHAALSAVYDWADCAGELAAPGNAFEVPETLATWASGPA